MAELEPISRSNSLNSGHEKSLCPSPARSIETRSVSPEAKNGSERGNRTPLSRLKSSYLFRSVANRSCGPASMFQRLEDASDLYPYEYALPVSQSDITEDGYPPDQRAGPISAHMHLMVWIKKGMNVPKEHSAATIEVSFLNQAFRQPFHPESGCDEPFQFFVHESTMVIEETLFPDQNAMALVRIRYLSTLCNGNEKTVGSAEFSLKGLLRQPVQGMDLRVVIIDSDESIDSGESSAPFEIMANFQLMPLEPDSQDMQIRSFALTVVSCRNLPKMDLLGSCDPFCEIKFCGQLRKTSVVSNTYSATWSETFQFHVAGNEEVTELCFQLYDADMTRKELVGQHIIPKEIMARILRRPKGWRITYSFPLEREAGQEAIGFNRKRTVVTIKFTALEARQINWSSPTLVSILQASEGEYKLRKPYVLRLAEAQMQKDSDVDMHRNALRTLWFSWIRPRLGLNGKDVEYYWREELEKILEGPFVAIIIGSMIIVDVVLLIDFEALLKGDDTSTAITTVSGVVLFSFVVEVLLRNVAQLERFWTMPANIFDFIVVWTSVGMAVANRFLESKLNPVPEQAIIDSMAPQIAANAQYQQTTDVLKITSRIFLVMRFLRIVLYMRRLKKLGGQIRLQIRVAVSQNKRRYIKEGFNLDLAYVTDRVLVMSAPAFGGHSNYRNDIREVQRFFSSRHYAHYQIFNFCDTADSSDGVTGNYHPKLIANQVRRMPFEDHGPPLLMELVQFCEEAALLLLNNAKNVICVHCKGGKGRSGLMAAAFLLWSGHRKCALDALELFTFRRTSDYHPEDGLESYDNVRSKRQNVGVQGPSQIRYVHYLEAILYCKIQPEARTFMILKEIKMPVGIHQASKPWYLSCQILNMRSVVYESAIEENSEFYLGGVLDSSCFIPVDAVVGGDVRINFFLHRPGTKNKDRVLAFFVVFNTNFYVDSQTINFRKERIDMLAKDIQNKLTHADFHICLSVSYSPDSCDQLKILHQFHSLIVAKGESVWMRKGDPIVTTKMIEETLFLILEGAAEGIVEEFDNQAPHPLGRCIGRTERIRVPTVCIVGHNHILGTSQFLNHASSMTYQVRSSLFRAASLHVDFSLLDQWAQAWSDIATMGASKQFAFPGKDGRDSEWSLDEMIMLFKGLSISVATFVSRIAMEAFRIGRLRALDNCVQIQEVEVLRLQAQRHFSIPSFEQICYASKCWHKSEGNTKRQIRLLIFTKHVILDPEIYGPRLSKKSEVICSHQITGVQLERGLQPRTITLNFVFGSNGILEKCACDITPQTHEKTMKIYELLSCMFCKAKNDYLEQTQNTVETTFFQELLDRCAHVHSLRPGEQLAAVQRSDSLFMVRTGQLRVDRFGHVSKKLQAGACFGEAEFALHISSGIRTAQAISGPATVFELRWEDAMRFVKTGQVLEVLFYRAICQLLDRRKRLHLDEVFPGTWSAPDFAEMHGSMSFSSDPGELEVPEQLNLCI